MSSDQMKQLARRWVEEFGGGDPHVIDELSDANIVDHTAPPGLPPGLAGINAQRVMYNAAFPDLKFTLDDVIVEGDKIATRWTARGTHTGPLLNIPPTGRSVTIPGSNQFRVANGKVVEQWVFFDSGNMLQQLGVLPAPGH